MQVGSISQAITIKQRKTAWYKISLAKESYDNRKDNLFSPGFLKKASKKTDIDKALAKVVSEGSNHKRDHSSVTFNELCRFFFIPRLSTAARGSNATTRNRYNSNAKKTYSKKQGPNCNQKKYRSQPLLNQAPQPIISTFPAESVLLFRHLETNNIRPFLDPASGTGLSHLSEPSFPSRYLQQ